MIRFTEVVARAAAAPEARLEELTGPGHVLVLAPHPDDESLAIGGAIAAAVEAGTRVDVAVVTDGSRSHPHSVSHPPKALAALRRREAEAAVRQLSRGRSPLIWLGYPDQAAPEDEAAYAQAAALLAPALEKATAIWTCWNGDPHGDHQKVWQLARWLAARRAEEGHALRVFGCPVWGRVDGPAEGGETEGLLRFHTARWRARKARAVAAHASQMTALISDDPHGFRMAPDLAEHFIRSDEIFIPA